MTDNEFNQATGAWCHKPRDWGFSENLQTLYKLLDFQKTPSWVLTFGRVCYDLIRVQSISFDSFKIWDYGHNSTVLKNLKYEHNSTDGTYVYPRVTSQITWLGVFWKSTDLYKLLDFQKTPSWVLTYGWVCYDLIQESFKSISFDSFKKIWEYDQKSTVFKKIENTSIIRQMEHMSITCDVTTHVTVPFSKIQRLI